MASRIKLRRDTAATWTAEDPVLDPGEFGYETDTQRFKIGDGGTVWNSLLYVGQKFPDLMPQFTFAQLPAASSNTGSQVFVTDRGPGGGIPAFSDGIDWRQYDDNSILT